jgi:streptogramin lyase
MPNSIEPLELSPYSIADGQSATETESTTWAELRLLLNTERLRLPLISALLSLLSALILYLYSLAQRNKPAELASASTETQTGTAAYVLPASAAPFAWLLVGVGMSVASAATLLYYLGKRYLSQRRLARLPAATRTGKTVSQPVEPRSDHFAPAIMPMAHTPKAVSSLEYHLASSVSLVRATVMPSSPRQTDDGSLKQIARWYREPRKQAWIKLLLVGLAILVAIAGLRALAQDHLLQGVALVIGALLLWVVAFFQAEWMRDNVSVPFPPLSRNVEWVAITLVLMIGAFFRMYKLPDIPWGMSIDGAANAQKALDILHGAPYEPLFLSRETMYHYFMAASIKLFGANLMGVRLTSVFFGMLALLALYRLAREMFETRLALITTLVFAASIYPITFSRSDWRVVQVPVFECAALYFLWRAVRKGQLRWWALAGAMIGLGLNTYDSFRFVALTAALFVFLQFFRSGFVRSQWRGVILFGVCSIIFFGPLGVYAATHWREFSARAQAVFIGDRVEKGMSLQPLWENLVNATLTYVYHALGDFFDNSKPLLSPLEGLLYLGGLGVLLANIHRRRAWTLLLFFGIGLIPGIITLPNAQRLMAPTALTFLMGGIFVYAVWVLLKDAQIEMAVYPLLAVVATISVVWSYQIYLGPHRRIVWGYEPERMTVALYARSVRDTDHLIIEERFNDRQLDFMNYVPGADPFQHNFETFDLKRDIPLRRPVDRNLTIVLEDRPEYRALVPILQAFYPDLTVEELRGHYIPDESVAFAIRVPVSSINAAWGFSARYFATPDTTGQPLVERREPALPVSDAPPGAQSAVWEGQLWADELDEYVFKIDQASRAALDIDGQRVISGTGSGQALLTQGLHRLRLQAAGDLSHVRLLQKDGSPLSPQLVFAKSDVPASLVGKLAQADPVSWRLVWQVGGPGTEPGHFNRPMNIVVDETGMIYVGDADNRRVVKLDGNGNYIAHWGRWGDDASGLEHEVGLALGQQDEIFVVDRWHDRVQAWSRTGQFRGVRVPPGEVGAPHGAVMLPNGDLLVTSPGHHQVRRFSADGTLRDAWGQPGTGPGQFVEPIGLAYDPRGYVYVTDGSKHTIQQYTVAGVFLQEWLIPGVTWESYVAVDPEGRVHVSAPDENTVYTFTSEGVPLARGSLTNQFYPFSIPLNHPMGLAFDAQGNLYLTNTWANQVMKFELVTNK